MQNPAKPIYAKSDGTSLQNHTKSVINISMTVLKKILKPSVSGYSQEQYNSLRTKVATAAMLHDIGKISPVFQKYIKKKASPLSGLDDTFFELNSLPARTPFILHNIISWAYASLFLENPSRQVLSSVLYHHVVPVLPKNAKQDCTKPNNIIYNDILLPEDSLKAMHGFFDEMSSYLNEAYGISVRRVKHKNSDDTDYTNVPLVNTIVCEDYHEDMFIAAEHFIVRSVLVYADRLASSYPESLARFKDNDTAYIDAFYEKMLFATSVTFPSNLPELGYTDISRNEYQDKIFSAFCDSVNPVLNATAGFGKTMMGLRWHIRNSKKTLWVCPQNSICNEAFNSLKSELSSLGLSDKISVALYLTGEFKEGTSPDAEIIVTNIDNYLAPVIRNRDAGMMLRMLSANVIFDETQQFFSRNPMYAAFMTVVYCRTAMTESRTLMMSATPLDVSAFCPEGSVTTEFSVDGKPCRRFSYASDTKVRMDSQKADSFRDLKLPCRDCFVVVPSVRMVQDAYLSDSQEDNGIVHARYTKDDRKVHTDGIYNRHGKKTPRSQRNTFYGNGIINTGLNVSAECILDIPLTPADTIQVLGRAGRYPDTDGYESVCYCVLDMDGSDYARDIDAVTEERYDIRLSVKWRKFLIGFSGRTLTKGELYEKYDDFNRENHKEIFNMQRSFLETSFNDLTKLRPYSVWRKKSGSSESKDELMTLASGRLGFRGVSDNVYVCCANNPDKILSVESDRVIRKLNPEWGDESSTAASKNRLNHFMQTVPEYKRKFGNSLPSVEEQIRIGKNPESPIMLTYSTYTEETGLRF